MSHSSEGAAPAEPARYELRVKGVLDSGWSAWFEGLRVTSDQAGQTIIAGPVTDQAAFTSPVTVWIDLGNAAPYSGGRVLRTEVFSWGA
jgi:hypothetical protein